MKIVSERPASGGGIRTLACTDLRAEGPGAFSMAQRVGNWMNLMLKKNLGEKFVLDPKISRFFGGKVRSQ